MAFVQPGTRRGMFLHRMGSRKTVPPKMFLMVPLGLFHIFFSLNSGRRICCKHLSLEDCTCIYIHIYQMILTCIVYLFEGSLVANTSLKWLKHFVQGKNRTVCNQNLTFSEPDLPSTLASSGVIVAHLTATLYFIVAKAESIVTWSSVWSR